MSFTIHQELPSPDVLKELYPLSPALAAQKAVRDQELRDIFEGRSDKFILIVGPCSADSEDSVTEYVRRLKDVNEKVQDKLFIIPRVYTNKPRTTGEGYKGMLHQPDPNSKPDLLSGIVSIRRMHLRILEETGLSAADEMLYPSNRDYFDDVLAYEAVGARSVENQQHRLVASGADIPVGMKNPTSGDLSVMINSVIAAQADAESMKIQGEGIAQQRIAIAEGLARSLSTIQESGLSSNEANMLLMFTQRLGMLEKFAEKGSSTLLIPEDLGSTDVMAQVMAAIEAERRDGGKA